MRFNGTILITDPCYIIDDKKNNDNSLWLFMLDIFNKKLPTYKAPNPQHIDYLKFRINEEKEFIKRIKDDKEFISERLQKIEEYKQKIETLNRPENFISVPNREKPAENFLSSFGFTDCIWGDTLYGDWSATVFNSDTNEEIGIFCADAGLYSVMYLDEVLKFNPNFNCHIEKPWTSTVIKNFVGEINVEIREEKYEYNGETKIDKAVYIVGKGNINFEANQTGF